MNFLLLRGLVREQRHWGDFPARLERLLPGARTFFLDLPGTGTEHGRQAPATVSETVTDLEGRFEALRRDAPGAWSLIGISLGGVVALDWCARASSPFSRAIAINTSVRPHARLHERLAPSCYPGILRALFSREAFARESEILAMTANRRDLDLACIAKRYAQYAREHPVSCGTLMRQLMAAARAELRPPRIPVLIVASRGDRLVSSVCSERLARALASPLAVHPDAGHDLPLDDGPWLARTIADFVRGSGELARESL